MLIRPPSGSGSSGGGGGGGGVPTVVGLTNTYILSVAGETLSGIGFNAEGTGIGITVVVPASAGPVPAAGNNANTIINTGVGDQTGIVAAILYNSNALTGKYSGTIADFVQGMQKQYATGLPVDVGVVPQEYLPLSALPTDSAGHPLFGLTDASSVQANVLGGADSGFNALIVAGQRKSGTFSVTNPAGQTTLFDTGNGAHYKGYSIQITSSGSTPNCQLQTSDDNGTTWNTINVWNANSTGTIQTNAPQTTGITYQANSHAGRVRLQLVSLGSGTFSCNYTMSTVPITPVIQPSQLVSDNALLTASGLGMLSSFNIGKVTQAAQKGSSGNFFGVTLQNLYTQTLYFNIFNASTVTGTAIHAIAFPPGTNSYFFPNPRFGLPFTTQFSWNVSDTIGSTTAHATGGGAADVNSTVFYV